MTASSAMLAACMSSVVLGSFMCSLVVLCRKFGLDPGRSYHNLAHCSDSHTTRYRQYCPTNSSMSRRPSNPPSTRSRIISQHCPDQDTLSSHHDHRPSRSCCRLGCCDKPQSSSESPPLGGLGSSLRCDGHQLWYRNCAGSIRKPI